MGDGRISAADLMVVVEAVEDRVRRHDYAGADPFDGLAAARLPQVARSTARSRQAVVQAFKRSPVNLRAPAGVRPRRIAKALGLFSSAYSLLDQSGSRLPSRECGRRLLHWLVEQRRLSSDPRAWGYEFDVQTRWAFYPARTPNVIVTTFVGNACLDWYGRAPDEATLAVASQAADWITEALSVEREGGLYFGYVPGVTTLIHNANALAAGFLARYGSLSGDDAAVTTARQAAQVVIDGQQADGLWPYGEGASLRWIDGFHTAYVLGGLLDVWEATGDDDLLPVLERGTHAYAAKLFDGPVPRFSDTSLYPIDVHCASSAIDYFARAAELDAGYLDKAWNIATWAISELYDPSGAFYYQRTRWYVNKISYIRWSDAHMLRALARLLAVTGSLEPHEAHHTGSSR
jgi:hypothetical protein